MRIIILGPPGSGKGTQAKMLAEQYGLRHLSTGDLFRKAMQSGTEVGVEAKSYIDRGELVPDEVTWRIVATPLEEMDFTGFILDGYPRTIHQAECLLYFLNKPHLAPPIVLSLEVPDADLVDRLSRRRMHRKTGEIYHLDYNPPPPDVLPEDLVHRRDDQPEVINHRLEVYHEQTEPIKAFYASHGHLYKVDGTGEIGDVHARVCDAVGLPVTDA